MLGDQVAGDVGHEAIVEGDQIAGDWAQTVEVEGDQSVGSELQGDDGMEVDDIRGDENGDSTGEDMGYSSGKQVSENKLRLGDDEYVGSLSHRAQTSSVVIWKPFNGATILSSSLEKAE